MTERFRELGLALLSGVLALSAVACVPAGRFGPEGQASSAVTPSAVTPTAPGVEATSVSAGGGFACVLTAGGAVLCWGRNEHGQLGDGTTKDRSTPVAVVGLGSGVRAVSAGGSHACALTARGTVSCWGSNKNGQLGDATTKRRPIPVGVVGLGADVKALAAGYGYTCALTTGGRAKCWGDNSDGQLGDGTTKRRLRPVNVVGGAHLRTIAVNYNRTCAVTSGRGVTCWGWISGMTAGGGEEGSTKVSSTPVPVADMWATVRTVAVGSASSCALTTDDAVKCWGNNDHGELGIGDASDRETPEDVVGLGSGTLAVATGDNHACAVVARGEVTCWGWNKYGQLGDGTTTDRFKPVNVVDVGSMIRGITAGDSLSCALTTDGGVKCWGNNDHGQLGDGTTVDRRSPVAVLGLGPQ